MRNREIQTQNGIKDVDNIMPTVQTSCGTKRILIRKSMVASLLVDNHFAYYEGSAWFYCKSEGIWVRLDEKELKKCINTYYKALCGQNYQWSLQLGKELLEEFSLQVKDRDFSINKNHFCLENGVFNIFNGKTYKCSSKYNLTYRFPIEYDVDAKCPRFQQFLEEVTNQNKERLNTILELMGYCLTRDTRAQKLFFLVGNGANGKSVLVEIMESLIGKCNVSYLTMKDMEDSFLLSKLIGKNINFMTDLDFKDSRNLMTGTLKRICGQDSLQANIKYKDPISFKPYCKVVILSNFYPDLGHDSTYGAKRRIVLIPFERTFSEGERDVHLVEKLKMEMSGIFNLAIEGYRRLIENNYVFSCEVESNELIRKQNKSKNPISYFVDDCIFASNGDKVSYRDLIKRFKQWKEENRVQYSENNFSKEVSNVIFERFPNADRFISNSKRGITNVSIRSINSIDSFNKKN